MALKARMAPLTGKIYRRRQSIDQILDRKRIGIDKAQYGDRRPGELGSQRRELEVEAIVCVKPRLIEIPAPRVAGKCKVCG
jgi:hypothetical protein